MVKFLGIFFPFIDFLYILQLEEYNVPAYCRWIKTRLLKRDFQNVGKIEPTFKVYILFLLTLLFYASSVIGILYSPIPLVVALFGVLAATFAIPFFVALAGFVFSPLDNIVKGLIIARAKRKLRTHARCDVVAIAGSYGKTSTRWFLFQLVSGYTKAQTPAKNINTFIGLAQDILRNLKSDTSLFVVELGEYRPGDLKRFCDVLRPKIVALTTVGPQHLDSFQSQEAIDQEFLSFLRTTKNVKQFVNSENPGVMRILERYRHSVERSARQRLSTYFSSGKLPKVLQVPFMQENAAVAVAVAEHLGVPKDEIKKKLEKLTPYERRFEIREMGNISVIDDSYNINPESAAAALRYLTSYAERRKVLVTGGIVEQGGESERVNTDYGEKIGQSVDGVIVAKNNFAQWIEKGVKRNGRTIDFIFSPHPRETPEILKTYLRPGDVVLIQNELPDLYWH